MVIVIVQIFRNPNPKEQFRWRMDVSGLSEAHSREFIKSFGLDPSGFSLWKVSDDKLSIFIDLKGDWHKIPIPQAAVYLNMLQTMQSLKLVATNFIVKKEQYDSIMWTLQN